MSSEVDSSPRSTIRRTKYALDSGSKRKWLFSDGGECYLNRFGFEKSRLDDFVRFFLKMFQMFVQCGTADTSEVSATV